MQTEYIWRWLNFSYQLENFVWGLSSHGQPLNPAWPSYPRSFLETLNYVWLDSVQFLISDSSARRQSLIKENLKDSNMHNWIKNVIIKTLDDNYLIDCISFHVLMT